MSLNQTERFCELRVRRGREGVKEGDLNKLARAFKGVKAAMEIVGPAYKEIDALCKEHLPEQEHVEGVLLSHQNRFAPAVLSLGWCKDNGRDDLIKESVVGSKFKKEAEVAEDPIRLAIIEAESRMIPRITVSANGTQEDE